MLGVYSLLIKFNFSIYTVIVLFGLFVAVTMTLVRERHMLNQRTGPLPQIPSDMKHRVAGQARGPVVTGERRKSS